MSILVNLMGFSNAIYNGHDFADYPMPNGDLNVYDPYGALRVEGAVDMHPAGRGSQDGSLNSGYSTPSSNQRRVIREIIV